MYVYARLEDVAEDPKRLSRAMELVEREVSEVLARDGASPRLPYVRAVERHGDTLTAVWVVDNETGEQIEFVRKPNAK